MKIAICATDETLDGHLPAEFADSPWFILLDTETGERRSVSNGGLKIPGNRGVQAVNQLVGEGTDALIADIVDPYSYAEIIKWRITLYSGVEGSIRDALDRYLAGELVAEDPSIPPFADRLSSRPRKGKIVNKNGEVSARRETYFDVKWRHGI